MMNATSINECWRLKVDLKIDLYKKGICRDKV